MKCYVSKETGNLIVKGKSPLVALRKIVRRCINKMKKCDSRIDIFSQINKRPFTLIDEHGKVLEYIVSIIKDEDNTFKSLYYKVDYRMEIYKKLTDI